MEERTSRLEAHVEHIQRDVTEIKGDIRRLDAKIDTVKNGLDAKIDTVKDSLDAKMDAVKDAVAALSLSTEKSFSKVHESIASAKIWAVGLYVTLLAGMASGFMWIIERLPRAH